MSVHDITPKPIGDIALFYKTLIPADIPETYALKPELKKIAGDEEIRKGVVAFRDFLYLLCDRLISDGHLYAKTPLHPNGIADYPFLNNLSNLLVEIGYYGQPAESRDTFFIPEIPSCAAYIDANGKKKAPRIPASGLVECLRFLSLCGFVFKGVDLNAKALKKILPQTLEASFPENPVMLTGLKAMSVADKELRTERRYWNNCNILRCDYRLLKAEETDILDRLNDFLRPLPERVREFAMRLHKRYTDMGLTCVLTISGDVCLAYARVGESRRALSQRDIYQQRVWAFSNSIKNGYCMFVRSKRTDKYAGAIAQFPAHLRELIAKGYGCDRKLRNERCQHGCQGIRIPLDESILDIGGDIVTWLDNETPVFTL